MYSKLPLYAVFQVIPWEVVTQAVPCIYEVYIFVTVVVFRHNMHQRVLLFCLCLGTEIHIYSLMVLEKVLKHAHHVFS